MRACNKCKADVSGDMISFEGTFIDWNYDLDLCLDCTVEFKKFVDKFCNVVIDTNEKLSEEEKAEREPVSKAYKKLIESKEKIRNDASLFKRYV